MKVEDDRKLYSRPQVFFQLTIIPHIKVDKKTFPSVLIGQFNSRQPCPPDENQTLKVCFKPSFLLHSTPTLASV